MSAPPAEGGGVASAPPPAPKPSIISWSQLQNLVHKNNKSNQCAELIDCIVFRESHAGLSGGNPKLTIPNGLGAGFFTNHTSGINGGGAKGLMQLESCHNLGPCVAPYNPFNPATNIQVGSAFLQQKINLRGLTRGVAGFGTGSEYASQVLKCLKDLQAGNAGGLMRLLPPPSRTAIPAALLIIAAVSTVAAVSQQHGGTANGNQERVWATLRNQKPSVIGCFRVRESNCDRYPHEPCRGLLVQALEFRWDGLRPNELKVTDLDHHRVILVDRDVDAFLYALPLDPGSGTLLATVWGTGTTMGVVRVYRFHGDSVKLVFYNGSRFSPQFIVANEATPIPLIMLDRYTGGIDEIRPQETEIWRWDSAKEKFYAAATVPVNQRFEAVAKLEREAKNK